MTSNLARNTPSQLITRLNAHLRAPLFRNGYALVFNSAATSVLGLIYWIVAANLYDAETVGMNNALISTMMFLANVTQLNLTNGLNRFLPTAGQATARFIFIVYAICLVATPLACLVYFWGIEWWTPSLSAQIGAGYFAVWFVLATMAWTIFALQDSVLVGLRQATWVPIENLVFSVVKLILLVAMATLLNQVGIFISWAIPMALLLLPINWLIFARLAPAHARNQNVKSDTLSIPVIARYVAGDYASALIWTATTTLLPVLVLEQAGAAAAAYVSMAWTIAYSLYLVSRNMGMSLVSEASIDPSNLATLGFRTISQTFKLMIPAVLLVVVGAGPLMRLFGKEYSAEATTLLQLLALSALPAVVTSLYISVVRVQRRVWAVIVVQTSICLLVLGIAYAFLQPLGVTAIGVAWLVAQSAVALVLLLGELRPFWQHHLLLENAFKAAGWLRHLLSLRAIRQQSRQVNLQIDPILTRLTQQAGLSQADSWQLQRVVPTLNETTVAIIGPPTGPAMAMVKLPRTRIAENYAMHQYAVLEQLHSDERLGEFRSLLPKALVCDHSIGQTYLVEQMLAGQDGRALLADPEKRERFLNSAVTALRQLHTPTTLPNKIEGELLVQWLHEPIATLRHLYKQRLRPNRYLQALDRLEQELLGAMLGRTVAVGWVHGDFTPGNILTSADGATLTGVVDWELAAANDLQQLDVILLLLAVRLEVKSVELGRVVNELLAANQWSAHEAALLSAAAREMPGEELSLHTLVLLCWLRHVSATIAKSERWGKHWLWVRNNIDRVLLEL